MENPMNKWMIGETPLFWETSDHIPVDAELVIGIGD